jgi:hypothetical protein
LRRSVSLDLGEALWSPVVLCHEPSLLTVRLWHPSDFIDRTTLFALD